MDVIPPEVVVLGGGPAGCAAARLLASWGHRVRIVTRPAADVRLGVSLTPSCLKLFEAIGVTDAIDAAGFVRSSGNTVWWASDEPRVEAFVQGRRGWQVHGHRLDEILLGEAALAGATIERRVVREREANDLLSSSDFTLDCSGRAGILARAMRLRRYDKGPRTIALVAEWRRDSPWPVPDDSHTLVESYATGWAWSIPVASSAGPQGPRTAPSVRHVAVMVDPQRSELARGAAARDVYETEILKTRVFSALTSEASLVAGPWGWDASTYRSTRYAGDGWLLAGDAGSFIDPLSSAGVKKALASGWLAAIVAHTCITRPEMRTHALEFFTERESRIEAECSRASRRFLAAAAPTHRHPFWADRAEVVGPEGEPGSLEDGSAIPAAFDRLRRASALSLRRNPGLRVESRPAVAGREIVLQARIITQDCQDGVRYVRNVDVLSLVDMAASQAQVADLFSAYCDRLAPVELPDFLYALATAVAQGWLVAE